MRIKGFSFSEGNSKMHRVGSFSVLPVTTCAKNAPCAKDGCYACKMIRIYPSVRKAYTDNTVALMQDKRYNEFVKACDLFIDMNEYRLFRFNVSGDFFNTDYLLACCEIAKHNPETKFLAFTKQFEVANTVIAMGEVPSNFNIVFSAWNDFLPENANSVPMAYMDDGKHAGLVPDYAIKCDGNCQKCKKCFNLKNGEAVKFSKH